MSKPNTVDTILSNFWHYQNDHGKDRGITHNQAKSQLHKEMLGVIGEDISEDDDNNSMYHKVAAGAVRDYQREQRLALNKLLGMEE